MQFLAVPLGVLLALGLGVELILQVLQLTLDLLLSALGRLALLPLVVKLSLELSDLFGEVATNLFNLFFLSLQLPIVVGLGSL